MGDAGHRTGWWTPKANSCSGEIIRLLGEAKQGRKEALDEQMNLVYDDLRGVASAQLKDRFGDRAHAVSLQPTALVNEAYLRLIKQRNVQGLKTPTRETVSSPTPRNLAGRG